MSTAPAVPPASVELAELRRARVALTWLADSGNQALWRRVAQHGPVAVLNGLLELGFASTLWAGDEPVGGGRAGSRPAGVDPLALADAALAHTRRLGARVVIPEDDEWPVRLDELIKICVSHGDPLDQNAAPPLCLWVRGPHRLAEALQQSVAVVGARAATGYGAHAAREIGYGLAEAGWSVVSGGAFGIDAHAHRGALAAGGCTVVMLACGIDRAYPAAHANLFDRIAEDGLLVSEWPPGTDPFRHRFLIRNRLIAAGTSGTVLVEAAARSGARQTLRRAGQLSRAQLVVPGPVTSAMSVGCHEELREPPARLVTGVPHILEEVGRIGADLAPVPRGPAHARDQLEPVERCLVEALLKRKPLAAEAIAARARVPVMAAIRTLPSLVVRGFAQRRGDGFVLAPPADGPTDPKV